MYFALEFYFLLHCHRNQQNNIILIQEDEIEKLVALDEVSSPYSEDSVDGGKQVEFQATL